MPAAIRHFRRDMPMICHLLPCLCHDDAITLRQRVCHMLLRYAMRRRFDTAADSCR